MPLGRSYSTHQGQGTATIFDNSNLVNAIARQVQQKKAKQAEDDEYYKQQFAKINPNGVRDIDMTQRINPAMDKMYDAYAKIGSARSREEKLRAQAETQRAQQEVLNAIAGSKELNKTYTGFLHNTMNFKEKEKHPELSKVIGEYQNLAYDDPRMKEIMSPTYWSKKEAYDIMKLNEGILKNSSKDINVRPEDFRLIGGSNTLSAKGGKRLTYDGIKNSLAGLASSDAEAALAILKANKNAFDEKVLRNDKGDIQLAKQLGIKNYDPSSQEDFYALMQFAHNKDNSLYNDIKDVHIARDKPDKGGGDDDKVDAVTYRQNLVNDMMNGSGMAINELSEYLPKQTLGGQVRRTTVAYDKDKFGRRIIRFTVPQFEDDQGNKIQGQVREILVKDKTPDERNATANLINSYVSQLTGERIDQSKFNTYKGKKLGTGKNEVPQKKKTDSKNKLKPGSLDNIS